MKNYKIIMMSLVVLAFASCKTYQHTSRMTNIQNQPIMTNQTRVDVRCDFTKRVVAESGWCGSREAAMQEANYKAILNNNIDIVVSPIYSIQIKPTKRLGYKAALTGLAGYYENPQTITLKQQVEELNSISREDIEKYLLLYNDNSLQYLYPVTDMQSIVINAGDAESAAPVSVQPKAEAPKQPKVEAPVHSKPVATPRTSSSRSSKSSLR